MALMRTERYSLQSLRKVHICDALQLAAHDMPLDFLLVVDTDVPVVAREDLLGDAEEPRVEGVEALNPLGLATVSGPTKSSAVHALTPRRTVLAKLTPR